MNRNPWRSRVWLSGLFDVVAGGVAAVLVYVGITEGLSVIDAASGIVAAGLAVAVKLGVIQGGEAQTTPLEDPRDSHGIALIPWTEAEQWAQPAGHEGVTLPSGAVFADDEGDTA
jgi:hypothetical protein